LCRFYGREFPFILSENWLGPCGGANLHVGERVRLVGWQIPQKPVRNEHGVITVEVDQLQLLRDVASSRPVG